MILENYYYWFKSALSPEICNKIIDYGMEKMAETEKLYGERSTDATTFDHKQKGGTLGDEPAGQISARALTKQGMKQKGLDPSQIYIRDTKVSWIDDRWIYDLLQPYIHQANKDAKWNFEWDFSESCQFTKYGQEQFYGWHADAGHEHYVEFDEDTDEVLTHEDGTPILDAGGFTVPKNRYATRDKNKVGKTRKISMTVNLTNPDNYDGGDLKFDFGPHNDKRYHTCKEIRPKGSIIVFPSFVHHQVTPVTRGTRYSLVMWNLGKPFK